jgi:1-acyl-sn-glycerol-3-phosphate acyltransferase
MDQHGVAVMRRKYISPKSSEVIVNLAKLAWPLMMRLKHGPVEIEIVGDGVERFGKLKPDRLMICPNHPSEEDAEILFGLSRILRESFCYLTAHEVFHGHAGLNRPFLTRLGCYSVERGTKDVAAYKMTRDLLIDNKHKLVAFPEGEISHLNDIVMPLERGLVQMAFSALEKVVAIDPSQDIKILPVAVKYFFSENIDAQLSRSLDIIEEKLELCKIDAMSNCVRARRAMLQTISYLEKRFNRVVSPDVEFKTRVADLRWAILYFVADRLSVKLPRFELQVECAHMLKSILCDIHYHELPANGLRKSELKMLYKDVLTVINLIAVEDSFVGKAYADVDQENIWEIVKILELLHHRRCSIKSASLILVKFGEPVSLGSFRAEYEKCRSVAVAKVNNLIYEQLVTLLNELDEHFQSKCWANDLISNRKMRKAF